MIIIGEKLNSSITKTLQAINNSDEGYIEQLIKAQSENGAQYLDLNTALCGREELQKLQWMISLVKKYSNCGIMLDSPSADVIKEAIGSIDDRPVIINSVTITQRINELLPVALETGASIVGLPIDEEGIPDSLEKKITNSKILVDKIMDFGIPAERIYIDILVEALFSGCGKEINSINAIKEIKKIYSEVKTICGLSNISFGLPKRANINCAFLAAAIVNGLDSAIMDNTIPSIMDTVYASLAIAGNDEYCMNYISHIRNPKQDKDPCS
jgi:cobalamin-dependent methionine synthase I